MNRQRASAPWEYTDVSGRTWHAEWRADGTLHRVLLRARSAGVRTATNPRVLRRTVASADRWAQEQLRRCARQILARGTKQQAKAVLAHADRDVIARATQRLQRAQRNRVAADVFERTGSFPDA